jgi:hypothetical protein
VFGSLLVAASLLSASPACAQAAAEKAQPATLRVDPLLLAEAHEVWGLISSPGNPIWPGWDASGTPLLLYLPGQQDVLINHPHPPDGFVPYEGPVQFPGWRILVKNGPTLIELDGQNTSKEVEGIQTLVVADPLSSLRANVSSLLQDARPAADKVRSLGLFNLATDPYGQLATVVHEGFHVYQDKVAPDKGAEDMLLLYYPVLSAQNNVGFALEGTALNQALHAANPAALRHAAVRWLAVRRDRRASLPPKAAEYEDGVEFTEGLAKYTEYRLFQVLEGRQPGPAILWAQGFNGYASLAPQRQQLVERMVQNMSGVINVNNDPYGTAPLRMRLYYSGMAEGVMLDQLSPNWKSRIFAADVSLTSLLEEALEPTPAELDRALQEAKTDPAYDSLVQSKTKLAQEGHARADALVKEIEAGPGIGLIVDYSQLSSPKLSMGFTPFGITLIDNDRTVFSQTPIQVVFGKQGEVAQKVTVPLLRDTGRRLVRFRLPSSATRGDVEKALGSSQTGSPVNDLVLDLPGATVKAAEAQVSWKGNDLVVVMLNGGK